MSLDLIRKKHQWFTRIVLIFLSVTFILGIGYFTSNMKSLQGTGGGVAAQVNGEDIGFQLYYMERERIESIYKQQGLSDLSQLKTQINMMALQNVVDRALLAQKAQDLGFAATDEEVNKVITNDPRFQQDGRFIGKEMYENIIKRAYNMDPGQFEDLIREQILVQKIVNFIDQTALVTDENVYDAFKSDNDKIDLYYISFPKSDFKDDYSPSDEEVAKYYEGAKAQLMTPEMRKIDYIVLGPEDFEKSVNVSADEIESYYESYKEEFVSEDGSVKTLDEVRDQIEADLRANRGQSKMQDFLKNVEGQGDGRKDLKAIAAEQGNAEIIRSDLLGISDIRDDIPPNVVKSAFETEMGSTRVMPLGTSIWVIEVAEIAEPHEMTMEEATPQIIARLTEQHASGAARKKAYDTLGKLKEINKDELREKAGSMGLELKETGLFSRNDAVPGLNVSNLNKDAFEIDPGLTVSGRIFTDGDTYYLVSVKELREADPGEYEQNKESLKAQQLMAQRNDITQNLIQDLRREAEIIPNNKLFQN